MECHIRAATEDDIQAITDIYNDAVLNTTATFDTEIKSVTDRSDWLKAHGELYPVLVGEIGGRVIGYSSLTQYSSKKAYSATAELSVYVHKNFRGEGYGKRLIGHILVAGRKAGIKAVLSRIAGDNEVSVHLHDALDFFLVGTLVKVGVKFGKSLDVHIYQKLL